ncbi:DUF4349 domain-containing protein [Mycoplasmatota bacterium WC44]
MRKLFWSISMTIAILSMSACGDTKIEYVEVEVPTENTVTEYVEVEVPVEVEVAKEVIVTETVTESIDEETTQLSTSAENSNRKIIYTANLKMESEDLDDVYNSIISKLSLYDAYAENESISLNRFTMKIRVKTVNFTNFIESVKPTAEILSYNKSSVDVTTKYSTFTARKEALEAEHTRVLELIATAEKLEDIIYLEEFRADIEYELNYIGNELNKYDSLIEYSTLNLTVDRIIIKEPVKKTEPIIYSVKPTLIVLERSSDSITFKVINESTEDVASIYVSVTDNGEEIEELRAVNIKPGTYKELTVENLEADKHYDITAYSKEFGHEDSKIAAGGTRTKTTFIMDLGSGITNSIDSLVKVSKGFLVVVVSISPYIAILGVLYIPVRIIYRKYYKK